MSSYQIHAIATRALLDPAFKDALLNGQRRQKLQEFEIPPELVDVIMSIEGNDIHQFILELNKLAAASKDPAPQVQWQMMPIQLHCADEQEELHPANSQKNRSRSQRLSKDRGGHPNNSAG